MLHAEQGAGKETYFSQTPPALFKRAGFFYRGSLSNPTLRTQTVTLIGRTRQTSSALIRYAYSHKIDRLFAGGPRAATNSGNAAKKFMAHKTRILLLEDGQESFIKLSGYAERRGYHVICVQDEKTLQLALVAASFNPAMWAVLVDAEISWADGLSVCQQIRGGGDLPVIMLSEKADDCDRILALELGADGHLAKPLSPRELLACIKAVHRGTQHCHSVAVSAAPRRCRFGPFCFDRFSRRVAHDNGAQLVLSVGECELLFALLQSPQLVLDRNQLHSLARGGECDLTGRAIDTQVSRLRKKLARISEGEEAIKTVWGKGYALALPVTAQ